MNDLAVRLAWIIELLDRHPTLTKEEVDAVSKCCRETIAELTALKKNVTFWCNEAMRLDKKADADRAMDEAMGPRKDPLHPMFRDHNCAYCRSGELPCKQGSYNLCDNPRARND